MRVLLTGAGGQLGRELVGAFAGHDLTATTHQQLDVTDRDAVFDAMVAAKPDAVVHAAAWTDVDGCESDTDRAWRVNSLATRHVVGAARLVGATVCYISTDYVFSGEGNRDAPRPYTEWDQTGPRSMYGRSKLGGELELGPEDLVVRTSWVCGRHGRNFVKTMLRLGVERDEIAVVDDQHGCPTFADDLATAVYRLVTGRLSGTFHVTNQVPTTWYQLAKDALSAAGLDPGKVRPVATADLDPPRPAPRPAWSVLDNAALRLSGLPLLPDHRDSLERLVKELGNQ
ncbi:MAG: dTDP-4-dehydrorhamnose reductase [Actinomycetota bacterium]|nr:dTDP-4-dehydrorhamnose reductase [Actinomycetota bacterium]